MEEEFETVLKAIRMGLKQHIERIIPDQAEDVTSGKMLRGCLTILTHNAINERKNVDMALDLATVVELLHYTSLVADGWIDGDLIRRGKASLHLNQKDSETLLKIIYLLSLPYSLAGKYGTECTKLLAQCQEDMSAGVLQEIRGATKEGGMPATALYRSILKKKTGVLFSVAAAYGAISAGGDADVVECMKEFGMSLGLAYQISDDLSDLPEVIKGKKSWGTEKMLLRAVKADGLLSELKRDLKEKKLRPAKALELFRDEYLQNRMMELVDRELRICRAIVEEMNFKDFYSGFFVDFSSYCTQLILKEEGKNERV